METINARGWVERFIKTVVDQAGELTELDRRAGDGDYGTNLRSALRRVEANLAGVASDAPDAVFTAVSDGFLNTGGTSGPLFGMWFREFSRSPELTTAALAEAAAGRDDPLADAVCSAASAAHAGAASTESLLAKRGRASYVGENARGVVDPGALTVALFFDAAS